MKKFVFLYYGGKKKEEMSKEDMPEIMEKWKAWFGSMGESIVDGGNPFDGAEAKSVMAKGVETIPADMWPAKGYTIVNAADMDGAVEMAKGCPILEEGDDGTVRVYEAMPM